MLTADMISMLCCPICRREPLQPRISNQDKDRILDGDLICDLCNSTYAIHSGIPDLIPYGVLDASEWQTWKDHLESLLARHEQGISRSSRLVKLLKNNLKTQVKFAEFVNITEGTVLDVGCGAGKFRLNLNENNIEYYGLDPVTVTEAKNFRYIRALAEYIPFEDSSFTDVIVLSAANHFQDFDKFLFETIRVLKPGGNLHILQNVHDTNRLTTAARRLAHTAKEFIEGQKTDCYNAETPRHMRKFSKNTLSETLSDCYEIVSETEYSYKWHGHRVTFLSGRPNSMYH